MENCFKFLTDNQDAILIDLKKYLEIASISSKESFNEETQKCAEYTADLLKAAGMEQVEIHQTKGHPVVVGRSSVKKELPTILIYGHYDVQPVDPVDLWTNSPFEPHIENDRIFARGAADDKGQIFIHIKAAEIIKKTSKELPVNLIFLIEGEEEIASPNLPDFLKENKDLLKADSAIISDTSMWELEKPAITLGLRGITCFEIELTGPDLDLHSGSFGGAVLNPLEELSRLISLAKDENGKIRIPGVYDKVRQITPLIRCK
jgi:acetylornithine deacetylase/succinyl-diaminopimelate desuccinylase-like protein